MSYYVISVDPRGPKSFNTSQIWYAILPAEIWNGRTTQEKDREESLVSGRC